MAEPTPTSRRLSIVAPAWNEEEMLPKLVTAAEELGSLLLSGGRFDDWELVVVDDASTDATAEVADRLAASNSHVRVVHHERNQGLGGALRTGFAQATGDLVLYTDSDLPFDLLDTLKAIRLLDLYEADVLSAYRLNRAGEGPRRWVYSYIYNHLVGALLSLRMRDVNFAFKLMRREVLDAIELRSEGSFIDVELLARAQGAGFTIVQMGVDYFPRTRGVSTLSSAPVILKILREMRELRGELSGASFTNGRA